MQISVGVKTTCFHQRNERGHWQLCFYACVAALRSSVAYGLALRALRWIKTRL